MFFDNMYSDPGLTMKRSKKEEISDCNDPGKLLRQDDAKAF